MKDVVSSITRNFTVMSGSQVVTWISSFVLMLFLPRYLGDEGSGRFYLAMSFSGLINVMMDLGFGSLFVKEIARDPEKAAHYFINGAILRIMAWGLVVPFLALYVFNSDYPQETVDVILILAIGEVLVGISSLTQVVFQGLERMVYRSYMAIVQRVALSLFGVIILVMGYGVETMAMVAVGSYALSLMVGLSIMPRLVKFKIDIRPRWWWSLLKQGFPFLLLSAFALIYYRIDVIMLSHMTNERVVGWYTVPYRLFDSLMFFPSLLHITIFPVFSRLWQGGGRDELAVTVRRVVDIIVIVGILIAAVTLALSKPIISFLFGLENFNNSVIILQILAITIPLVYVNFITGTVASAVDKQKKVSVIAAIAVFINVGLNWWLIPYFQQTMGNGGVGAGIATIITEIYIMVLFFSLVPKGILDWTIVTIAIRSSVAGVLTAGFVWWMDDQGLPFYLSGIAGTLAYVAMLIVTRVVTRQDISFITDLARLRTPDVSDTEPEPEQTRAL
ncbi:MAG: flippase [Candidatus Latescibacteria bacterium]|nr:flippase [Candidatus Latescibacterota bacterium]